MQIDEKALAAVDDIFNDLRGRRFLKWLFSEHPTYIGKLEGDPLNSLDADVQDEIKATWAKIVAKHFAALPPESPAQQPTTDAFQRDAEAIAAAFCERNSVPHDDGSFCADLELTLIEFALSQSPAKAGDA